MDRVKIAHELVLIADELHKLNPNKYKPETDLKAPEADKVEPAKPLKPDVIKPVKPADKAKPAIVK